MSSPQIERMSTIGTGDVGWVVIGEAAQQWKFHWDKISRPSSDNTWQLFGMDLELQGSTHQHI